MKHFVGSTAPELEALRNFLNSVCPLDSLTYWNVSDESSRTTNGSKNQSLNFQLEKGCSFVC